MAQIEGGNLVRFSQYAAPEKTRSADMPCNRVFACSGDVGLLLRHR